MKQLLIICITFCLLISCKKESASEKLTITASLFPLYDFVREIGKDKVEVNLLLPPGVEPHSYEPSPMDIIRINESDLFVYISETMEPWMGDLMKSSGKSGTLFIETSMVTDEHSPSDSQESGTKNTSSAEVSGDHHEHTGSDPHIWLDFTIDMKIVTLLAEEMGVLDPSNAVFYKENAALYREKLVILDRSYQETLDKCKLKTILYGGHFAFGYLSERYGLNHISPYSGFSANAEPTPQKVAELIDNIRKNNIEYLYYEELIEPKVALAIIKETGIQLELLHAGHNLTRAELDSNVTFLEIMNTNLLKLKKGLKYQ